MKPTSGDLNKTPVGSIGIDGPSKPRFVLPAGAVDAHCHVFGPGAEFPYAPERQIHTLRRFQSSSCLRCATTWVLTKNVIVQATCHGADNRALVDALRHSQRASAEGLPL
jgi:2-pyrone-4,6-dicarboxylate lactonase